MEPSIKQESWLIHWINLTLLFIAHLKGKIQVFALVGPSGTGKSFRARVVAERYKIRFIIDDGILIKDKRIIAGRSAKRENAYLSAVKTAIFDDRVHCHDVRSTIKRYKCRRILVLGTSDRMIFKICQALRLPDPIKMIFIHEIASSEEIQKATEHRKLFGRHVIPVPAREIRRTSPHIITAEIKLWSTQGLLRNDKVYEKTLVRPRFSTGEAIEIPDHILKPAIRNALEAWIPGAKLTGYRYKFEEGYHFNLIVTLPELSEILDTTDIDETLPPPARPEDLSRLLTLHLEKQTGAKIRQCNITFKTAKNRRR